MTLVLIVYYILLKEELKLTGEQTEKYDALTKEYDDKISTLMSDASLSKEAQKEKKMGLKRGRVRSLCCLLGGRVSRRTGRLRRRRALRSMRGLGNLLIWIGLRLCIV